MRFLILNGGYLSSTPSGGDRHLLALAGALAEHPDARSLEFYAPELARRWLPRCVDAWLYGDGFLGARAPHGAVATVLAYLGRLLRVLARIALVRRKAPAQVVLASPALVDLLPALFHRRLFGSRTVVFAFHVGDARAAGRPGRPLQARLSRLAGGPALHLLKRADRVVSSATWVEQQLEGLGIERRRLVRQLPIVDAEAVRASPALEAPDVLFVGRLVERKGVFDLIEAAATGRFELGLVGDGEERGELERRIAERELGDRVRLLGALSDAQVFGLMKGARVLALPSYEEGYGLVIAESLLAGTPAVAYALPHYQEVFGDALTVGSLVQVPKGDVRALASALERAVSEPRPAAPPEELMDAAGAARQVIELFESSRS